MKTIPRSEYPRPQFVRKEYVNLNGEWTCEFDFGRSGEARQRHLAKGFAQKIIVPFCPESELSGIGHTDFIEQMYYHRKIAIPARWKGKRILLHFGAVDYECKGYLDGKFIGMHAGGSSSFFFDITDAAAPGKSHDFVLFVRDLTRSGVQPTGKQSIEWKSAGCRYTRTTGIWQTVWMEAMDLSGLRKCRITPDLDNGMFAFEPVFFREERGLRWQITIKAEGKTVGKGEFAALSGQTQTIGLSLVRAWGPEDPFLYDIEFRVLRDGKAVDTVQSYAGLRKVHIEGDRLFLNNKELFVRLVLDQGFYRKGIWTAPTDADLKRDIELSMAAGFNGARLHQKVFEPRFHYWADKLGYLTWGESPSWGIRFHAPDASSLDLFEGLLNFQNEWREIVERDISVTSIIAWSPTNETGAGADKDLFRKIISRIYEQTKTLDPTRPCNECSGYQHVKTDLWTIHCYSKNVEELRRKMVETKPVFMNDPDFEKDAYRGQPYINDEFGGFLFVPPDKTGRFADNTWGYYGIEIKTPADFVKAIREQVECMTSDPRCSGFCYTQLTDVEQEQNGILTYDRIPKAPLKDLCRAFRAGRRRKK